MLSKFVGGTPDAQDGWCQVPWQLSEGQRGASWLLALVSGVCSGRPQAVTGQKGFFICDCLNLCDWTFDWLCLVSRGPRGERSVGNADRISGAMMCVLLRKGRFYGLGVKESSPVSGGCPEL